MLTRLCDCPPSILPALSQLLYIQKCKDWPLGAITIIQNKTNGSI